MSWDFYRGNILLLWAMHIVDVLNATLRSISLLYTTTQSTTRSKTVHGTLFVVAPSRAYTGPGIWTLGVSNSILILRWDIGNVLEHKHVGC